MPELPTGTVTFLFSDVEGSTRLLERHPAAYRAAVRRHHDLLRGAGEARGGAVFETVGDAVYAAFAHASDAVAAALAGQRALAAEPWPAGAAPRVRMGLHTGEADLQGGHYFGAPLYRCGRLMAAAHGGQVVLSAATQELVRDALPEGATLKDLGEHRLRDLQRPERVFQLLAPDLTPEFPPLRTLDALPNNLPLQLTSFVGRERELAAVRERLTRHRLLTLTGPGGTGKTRLALQVAADLLPEYPDGVWLVELAALADPALVPQAVAQAVGVREEPGRPLLATLADALRPRRLLLLLDNCEHLLDACARLVDALLRACPRLAVLATSREALGIAGEAPHRVPSLALPDAEHPPPVAALVQYDAVRLFAERAAVVQPTFAVTPENAAAVVELCRRLDGIPLALELAAARVRVLPVAQVLARLEDRFRLLTGGSRTALERHQTLQAAVDWSYDLLTDPEKVLFARLGVFAGGFTLEAAEMVASDQGPVAGPRPAAPASGRTPTTDHQPLITSEDVLDLLTRLVDRSLVVADAEPDGTARYRLLETLRQYARQRLAASVETDHVRARHAAHFLVFADQAEPQIRGTDPAPCLDRLELEMDNFRSALDWTEASGEAEVGLRLVAALFWFLAHRHPTDGQSWLSRLLVLSTTPTVAPAIRAKALNTAGWLAWRVGDLAAARASCEQALDLARRAGDRAQIAWALTGLGWFASARGEDAVARPLLEESLALYEAIGDRRDVAYPLRALATIAGRARDRDRAVAYFERALAIHRAVGDPNALGGVLLNQGTLARDFLDFTEARRLYEESLAFSRAAGNTIGTASTLYALARLALLQHDHAAAREAFVHSITIFHEAGMRRAAARTLGWLTAVAAAERQWDRALRLGGAAVALREAMDATDPGRPGRDEADVEQVRAQAAAALGEPTAAAAWATGQAMALDEAVAFALTEASLTP
jgi:predicted ATPase/class 3 adenylate cyclase